MDIDVFQVPAIVKRRIGIVVVTAAIFGLLGFAFVFLQPNVYRATTQILLDPERFSAVGQTAADTAAPVQAEQAIDSQIYVMQSFSVLSEAVRTLQLEKDPFFLGAPGLIGRLLGKTPAVSLPEDAAVAAASAALGTTLLIARADQSLVFTLTAQYPNAVRAAEIANTVSSVYLDKANRLGSDKSLKASMSLQVQAEELRKRLLEAEDRVATFRAENGLISTGEKGLVTDQQLEGLTEQLGGARAALEQQEINYDQVRSLTARDLEAGAIPEALQQTSVTTLRSRYAQTLDRVAELETHLGARHPQLQTARAQADSMRGQLEGELRRVQDSVRTTYERSKANVAALEARFDALRSANGQSGDARTRLAQLQSEAEAIRGVYTSFLTRAEELSRQYDIGAGNSRIISEALPPARTTRASALLVAIAGVLFGAAVGAALAVARELLDGRSLTDRQITELLGVPIVARVAPVDARGRTGEARFARIARRLRRSGTAAPASRSERLREAGITRVAYVVTDALAGALPATLVFAGAGGDSPDPALVPDIAAALADTGAVIDIAQASLPAASPLAGTLQKMQGGGVPVLQTLGYRRLDAQGEQRPRPRASGSLLSAAVRPVPADFTIIDATGEDAAARLVALVKASDAVAIVLRPGHVSRTEIRDLTQMLSPWKDRLVGAILIEAAS